MFYVGQKVVCVNDAPDIMSVLCGDTPNLAGLKSGAIYTVRAVRRHDHTGNFGLLLFEINRPILGGDDGREQPFYVGRFRPAVERKTDISIFTRMLTPSQEKVTT